MGSRVLQGELTPRASMLNIGTVHEDPERSESGKGPGKSCRSLTNDPKENTTTSQS
jgi:hypothetical protein